LKAKNLRVFCFLSGQPALGTIGLYGFMRSLRKPIPWWMPQRIGQYGGRSLTTFLPELYAEKKHSIGTRADAFTDCGFKSFRSRERKQGWGIALG
jgi:hypothetical protein